MVSICMPTSLLRVEVPFRSLSLSNDRCVQYRVRHSVFSTRFEDRTWMVAQSLSFPSALARNWLMSFSRVAWLSESTDMRASLPFSTGEATATREREVLRADAAASFVGASRLVDECKRSFESPRMAESEHDHPYPSRLLLRSPLSASTVLDRAHWTWSFPFKGVERPEQKGVNRGDLGFERMEPSPSDVAKGM